MGDNDGVPGANIDWALQEVIGQVAIAADAIGANDPAYTVSYVDVDNARLRIYRTSLTPDDFDVQKYLVLAPAGVSIVFEVAALSATEIDNLSNRLAALMPEFKAAGIRIHGWGPDYATGMEVLYTSTSPDTSTSSDAPVIPQRLREQLEIYGPGTVTFKVGEIQSIATFKKPESLN